MSDIRYFFQYILSTFENIDPNFASEGGVYCTKLSTANFAQVFIYSFPKKYYIVLRKHIFLNSKTFFVHEEIFSIRKYHFPDCNYQDKSKIRKSDYRFVIYATGMTETAATYWALDPFLS